MFRRRRPKKRESLVAADAPVWLRRIVDNVEGLAIALALALIVRAFALQAFNIPSDSMYPTLNGHTAGGDRVLVHMMHFLLGNEPRRWQVTVFRYPLDIRRFFVKRLVGLPGERLTIVDGDIWINRRLERKPPSLQRALWIERYPSVPEYHQPPPRGRWELVTSGWRIRGDRFLGRPPPGGAAVLRFDFGGAVPMDRDPARHVTMYYTDIRDYRVRGTVRATGGARAVVRLTVRDLPFQAVLPAGGGRAQVIFPRDRYPVRVVTEGGRRHHLPAGEAVAFEVAHYDWRFEVRVDGELWFAYELEPDADAWPGWPAPLRVRPTSLELRCEGGEVEFAHLAVDQDIHYTQRGLYDARIPPGHYFVLGDNSHGSRDSREWHRILVEEPRTGKRIWGEEYSWILDTEHMHDERRVNFQDLLGNGYWIPGFDRNDPLNLAGRSPAVERWEYYGFIPRAHIVGRAFLIFWPFPPFSPELRVGFVR